VTPSLSSERVAKLLAWAKSPNGDSYRMGAAGPTTWDCSSFIQAAYGQIGVKMLRTATAQRAWLAAGHAHASNPKPRDLIFWDSYLGPHPDRARHDHLESSQANHHRSTRHP
jgi:cell wall-associated NlpC family hydrolase